MHTHRLPRDQTSEPQRKYTPAKYKSATASAPWMHSNDSTIPGDGPERLSSDAQHRGRYSVLATVTDQARLIENHLHEIGVAVGERQKLRDKLNAQVNAELTRLRSQLYALESMNPLPSTDSIALERLVVSLTQEQRHHAVSSWRDVSHLRREIREHEKELQSVSLISSLLRQLEP